MPVVSFAGNKFNFPDGVTEQQIGAALSQYVEQHGGAAEFLPTPDTSKNTRTESTAITPREDYFPEGVESPVLQEVTPLNKNQQQFADVIAQVETGGLENRFVRTKLRPTKDASGSSAYGKYQITHGLLSGVVKDKTYGLTEQETLAAQELLQRQEIALTIGGRDRSKYEKGGESYAIAQKWAKVYGYESVAEFLDAFDYGGDFGLSDDEDFQVLYESFARKLLNRTLRDSEGDMIKAAGVWHGGPKGKSKSTQMYKNKVTKLLNTQE